jgi:hypothetical protein
MWNPPWRTRSLGAITFETAKGSIYTVMGHNTQRVKAYRPEHGKDFGQKKPSSRTVYVNFDDALAFGDAQGLSPVDHFVVDFDEPNRRVRLLCHAYGNWKPCVPWKSFKHFPEVGLAPLELFDEVQDGGKTGYTNWHPGNKIVRIS